MLGVLRPGGLDRGGARSVAGLPGTQWLVAGGLVIAVWMFATVPLAGLLGTGVGGTGSASFSDATLYLTVATSVGLAAAIGVVLLIGPRSAGSGLKADLISLPLGLAAFALVFPIVMLASIIATQAATALDQAPAAVAHDTLAEIVQQGGGPWGWLAIANVVLLVPIFEEILWRGLVQSGVRRFVGGAWIATLVTSAGFAAIHWSTISSQGIGTAVVATATLFLLSVGLGAAYERTRRIGVPIVMHALFNAAMIAIASLS